MKKHGVAILGFGVVGGGVADLITNNREEIKKYLGCEVEIKRSNGFFPDTIVILKSFINVAFLFFFFKINY